MKKLLAILVTIISVSFSAFAGDETVEKSVTDAFNKEFKGASNIHWIQGKNNTYQVTFVYNDKVRSAFYDKSGDLLGVTKNMLSIDLPYYLQKELKKYYKSYWVASLFELSNVEGTSYYVTLQDAETKMILKSTGNNSWEFYKEFKNP